MYRPVGLVPERDSVYAFLTGEQFVTATAELHRLVEPAAAASRAIDLLDMAAAADRKIATYSKGMRQRIKVAAALVHDPEILVLDEPFNGMDPRQRLHMMDLLDSSATRAGPSCSARTSWKRSSGCPASSRWWWPVGWPPRATTARSGG